MDDMLRMQSTESASATNPLFALVSNVHNRTLWTEGVSYDTYGTSLVRNIILSVCEAKSSRIDTDIIRFKPGDEIVFHVTFTGVVRVSASKPLERFGLSQNQLEENRADLDNASWLKLVCRIVR